MIALAFLLFATPQDPETVRQAIIAKCGIGADRLAVERVSEPPEDWVMVKGAAPLSDAQLDCFGQTLAGMEMVPFAFDDEALGKRYSRVSGRSGLAAMGLLNRLPVFNPKRDTLRSFAHRLERLCGARRGSLLVVQGENIAVREGAFDGDYDPSTHDPALCVVAALGASGFEPFGYVPLPELIIP